MEWDGYEWVVRYADFEYNLEREDIRESSFKVAGGRLETKLDAKVMSETELWLNGHPGRQIHLKGLNDSRVAVMRFFLVGQRLYVLGVVSLTKSEVPRDIDRFFSSFKLTPKNQ